MPSRRRLARIAVMQTVFEKQAREIDVDASIVRNIVDLGGADAVDGAFGRTVLRGVMEHWDAIASAIQTHAPEWPLERMDAITRAILFIGAFELLYGGDAPPAVVMNEAIEVAKEYGTTESAKFVNGVLNALAHAGKK